MADFFSQFWSLLINSGRLGGIDWMVNLLAVNSKHEAPRAGEDDKSTRRVWDGIEELNNPLPFG